MKRVLALDFDGVIWDSVGECFVMARRAYQNLYGLPCSDLEACFRRGRWLVRTGGDFLLVLQLAMADPERDLTHFDHQEFSQLQQQRAEECQEFAREFYRLREECREQHWDEWCSYQQAYPSFLQQLPRLREQFAEIAICTTKDRESARQLLQSAGLEFKIWGKESGLHKGEQMRQLFQELGVDPGQVYFIDDLVDNLLQVAPLGVACGLAGWGYNTEIERQRAREQGFPVLEPFTLCESLAQSWSNGCARPA